MSLSSGPPGRPASGAPGHPAQPGTPMPRLSPVSGERHETDWGGVSLGLALSCFVAFQQFKLPPVLPGLLAAFDYPRSLAAGFMSIYALIGLIASVPLGRWMKRRGYRPGLLIGIASTLAGLILALALARFGLALLLARGLEGLTYAIFAIAGPAIATASARLKDLPLVTGLLAGWIPVGQIGAGLLALAAPSLAPYDGLADWQLIWLVALALTLVLGLFCWRSSHHRDVGMAERPAKAPTPVTADTVGRESPAKSDHKDVEAAAQPRPAAQVAPTGPHLAAPLGPAVARPPRLPNLLAAGIFLLWSAQYFAFMTWLTQFLIEQHHLQPQAAVLVYLLPVVVLLACNLLTGWALGHGLKLLPALLASLILQGLVWALNPILDGGLGIVALLVYGICAGVIPTCLFHLPHFIVAHQRHRAAGGNGARAAAKAGPEAFATLMTGRNIGVFCGPLLLPQLLGWLGNWNSTALVIAALTWLGAGFALLLVRELR